MYLAGTMMFSIVGCGKSDSDDKKKKDSDDKGEAVSTIADALASAGNYTSGDYVLKALVSAGDYGKVELKTEGTVADKDASVGMSVSVEGAGQKVDLSLDDVFVVSGDYFYINLDTVIEALSDVETEFGYYKLPMPETDEKAGEELQEISKDFINAALDGIDVEANDDGTEFTAEIKEAEDYEKLVRNVIKYIDENQDDISAAYEESLNSVDYKAYLKDVLEDMSDDIKSAAELMGGTVSDDDLQDLIDSVDDIEIEDAEINLFEGFDEIKKSVDEMESSDFEEVDVTSSFKVVASEEEFSYALNIDAADDTMEMKLSVEYSFNVDEDAKVDAPEKVATITNIVEYAMENQDELAEIVEGVNTKWGDLLGDVDTDFGTDDDTDDDQDDVPESAADAAFSLSGNTYSVNLNGKDFDFTYDEAVFYDAECDNDAIFFDGDDVSVSLFLWEDFEYQSTLEYYADSYTDGSYNTHTLSGYDVATVEPEPNDYYIILGSQEMGNNCFVAMVYTYDDSITTEDVIDALF